MYLSPEHLSLNNTFTQVKPQLSTILEKGSGEVNEDVILCGKNGTYGVFDGATSLVQARYENNFTGGRLAAQLCADTFGTEKKDLRDCARLANEKIRKHAILQGVSYTLKEELWSTSAAVVRLHENSFTWCQMGDCHILVIYDDNTFSLLSKDPGHDVATLQAWRKQAADTSGSIMDIMADEIIRVRRGMNIDYGVLNGEPQALKFLQSGEESLAGVKDMLLFSDGLIPPRRNPAAAIDCDTVVALYFQGGLPELRKKIRATELTDLGCRVYPRFKTHDDISAVALNFSMNKR